ncbi:response regulator transcription factor [Thermosynechococcaceae cyanobacterium BACA0444]|uniref:Response regulator transcription factor n=1 Tax=Pseudocalidococcus azoricus BACA0444 TaxID=2918990 RepID=A0AAE4JYM6_9CYAN|nr:response regulator transcription factor [Pseudocalidococcus azoricus]MDS3859887.1 response regulator transcription factor [Pseudocalidococcus azoricus BACA0444]
MSEFLARLRALQRRVPQFQPQALTVGELTLDYATASLIHNPNSEINMIIPLTAKEFQLLEYFMKHPQQIRSSEQIKNQLWAMASESTSNVVAAQVRLQCKKITAFGDDHLIETVYGLGYRLKGSCQ